MLQNSTPESHITSLIRLIEIRLQTCVHSVEWHNQEEKITGGHSKESQQRACAYAEKQGFLLETLGPLSPCSGDLWEYNVASSLPAFPSPKEKRHIARVERFDLLLRRSCNIRKACTQRLCLVETTKEASVVPQPRFCWTSFLTLEKKYHVFGVFD